MCVSARLLASQAITLVTGEQARASAASGKTEPKTRTGFKTDTGVDADRGRYPYACDAYLGKAFQAARHFALAGADAAPGPGPAREDHLAISAGQQQNAPSNSGVPRRV